MEKPVPKVEVAVDLVNQPNRIIVFFATPDAASELGEFGSLYHYEGSNRYSLAVDSRYDFNEVLEYIKNYEN